MVNLLFKQFLHHLPVGVAFLEGQLLRYSFVNEHMDRLVGEGVLGKSILEHVGSLPPDFLRVLPEVFTAAEPYVAKGCFCVPSQGCPDPLCYDLSVIPYFTDQNQLRGLLLLAIDVREHETARQKAHELSLTTRHLDARLRVLTETAPLIAYSLDAQGVITYASPQWYRFTGQPVTADLTAVWPLLIHADDRLRVLYETEMARRSGSGWNVEYRLRRYDGQYRWVLSRTLPEVHPPDAPVFWHGALTEIHLQRELSETRRQGEAELRFLADSIPELVWTASAEGLVEYYNHYTLSYTGLTAEELGPTGWIGLLSLEEQAAAARRWIQSVASGKDFEGEYRLRRHDGLYRWHTIRARLLSDAMGPRWFGTCSDVEEQYRLRNTLQTQYDELVRAHHNLDTFVYAASHDLRQPSHNLRGLFDELRRSVLFADPEQHLLLRMVDTALLQLDNTLADLADSVQRQRQPAEEAKMIDVKVVVEEVLLGLRPQIREQEALIEVDIDSIHLLYSRANLRSVVHNLLSNALKFSHPTRPPHVAIRTYTTSLGHPVLEIQDNGIGMQVENPTHPTFHLFRRQHTHIAGMGVGLYLVQRIVSSQGGHLKVQSILEQGTTISIYWTINSLEQL